MLSMCVCVYIYTHTHTYTYTYKCIPAHDHSTIMKFLIFKSCEICCQLRVCACALARTHPCTHLYTPTYTYTHIYTYICIYTYI